MATVNELAALSDNVYDPSGAPSGWTRISQGSNPNGFYGAAYQRINPDGSREIVITFRGTELTDTGDLASDITIVSGQKPPQYDAAKAFYDQVVASSSGANISLTGHSLGGDLASLVAARAAADGGSVQAVAFNAVGAKNSLDDIGLDPNGTYANIKNYNAHFDPLSNDAQQIGEVYSVYVSSFALIPDWFEQLFVHAFPQPPIRLALNAYFGIDQHRIDNLVNANFTAAQRTPQYRDPLTFDLDGDGIETVGIDPNSPILFDHDGDGLKTATGWVGADDAFLVLDRNGNGTIDNGTELFGDSTPLTIGGNAADGFAALADQDTNADGMISSTDARFSQLRLWQDLNQNGLSEAGELFTLNQKGIAAIAVQKTENSTLLPNGNVLADLGHYTRTDRRLFCCPIRSITYA